MKPLVLNFTLFLIFMVLMGGIYFLFFSGPIEIENMPQDNQQDKIEEDLLIEDIKIGEGEEVKLGDLVSVHYSGTLLDGTKFDSSYDRQEPFQFTLGAGLVIEGWEKGVLGMKVGGKRKLVIPYSLGYGAEGIPGAIPPFASLVFEVELLEIVSK